MSRYILAAPGPSLTLGDCMGASRCGTLIAVNSALFTAPFARAVFAGDESWWRLHEPFLREWFMGERYTTCSNARNYGAKRFDRSPTPKQGVFGTNSGVQAISFVMNVLRADTILLLGFDCFWTPGGPKHVHGDHPEQLVDGTNGCGNPQSCESWIAEHARIADNASCEIINCSAQTALDCYERRTLGEAIHGK